MLPFPTSFNTKSWCGTPCGGKLLHQEGLVMAWPVDLVGRHSKDAIDEWVGRFLATAEASEFDTVLWVMQCIVKTGTLVKKPRWLFGLFWRLAQRLG